MSIQKACDFTVQYLMPVMGFWQHKAGLNRSFLIAITNQAEHTKYLKIARLWEMSKCDIEVPDLIQIE